MSGPSLPLHLLSPLSSSTSVSFSSPMPWPRRRIPYILSLLIFHSISPTTADMAGYEARNPYIINLNGDTNEIMSNGINNDDNDIESNYSNLRRRLKKSNQFSQVQVIPPGGGGDNPSSTTYQAARVYGDSGPSIHEGCLVICYQDAIARYGKEFADELKEGGFVYAECPYDVYNEETGMIESVIGPEITTSTATDGDGGDESSSSVGRRMSSLRHAHTHHDHDDSHHDHHDDDHDHRSLGATSERSRMWSTHDPTTGKLLVPYVIQSNVFATETYTTISAALTHIEERTGVIQFIPRAEFGDGFASEYIYFEQPLQNICASNVGKQTNVKTRIYVGWCNNMKYVGSLIHETLHSLGFWHEHTRPDRDAFLDVMWERIETGAETNFRLASMVNSLGSGYDFGSIMHYPSNGFLKAEYKSDPATAATLVPKRALEIYEVMGQRVKLSSSDVDQLRLLYQCSTGPRDEVSTYQGGVIPKDSLCSRECKCWEYALGECTSDTDCMGDLICGDGVMPPEEYPDLLPPVPVGAVNPTCGEYCHPQCCSAWGPSLVSCPQTCGSAPPQETIGWDMVPMRMCRRVGDSYTGPERPSTTTTTSPPESSTAASTTSTSTTSSVTPAATTTTTTTPATTTTSTTSTTKATTTTTTTTTTKATATTSINADWYVDWGRGSGMCVQDCVGDAPCGGRRETWEAPYPTVNICCGTMSWKAFSDCAYLPTVTSPPPPSPPTSLPTSNPTQPSTPKPTGTPTNSPTNGPTKNPTPGPTGSPTNNPTSKPTGTPTNVPTKGPTMSPTNGPTGNATSKPTPGPTTSSTKSPTEGPTKSPTSGPTGNPTNKPTPGPTTPPTESSTNKPTLSPTEKPTNSPTTSKPTSTPTSKPTVQPTTMVNFSGNKWYPDQVSNTNKCLNDNNKPSWLTFTYDSQSACCTAHFNWGYNNCMGTAPPSSSKWYIEWSVPGGGKCVQDCPKSDGGSCWGPVPGSWVMLHSTASACCSAHLNYVSYSQCVYTG